MKPKKIIFISGWAQPASSFEQVAEALGEPYELLSSISFFQGGECCEGQEASVPAGRLAAYLQKESGPVTLVGWSLGGMLALEQTLFYPEVVDSLVLVGSTPQFFQNARFRLGTPESVLDAFASELKSNPRELILRFLESVYAPTTIEPMLKKKKISHAEALGEELLESGLNYLSKISLVDKISTVSSRLLLLHGREDAVIPWQASEYLKRHVQGSRCKIIDGCGHGVVETHPQIVSDAIKSFI